MTDLLDVLALVVAVAVVSGLSRRFGFIEPIVLVLAGLGASFIPGVPAYLLDPEIVLVLFLPPLLYAASINVSVQDFRANLRPIALLSVGAVLFTTAVVGFAAWLVIPGLTPAAAIVLGAIVAPPDALAATTIARSAKLPRRIVTILEGESLVNDATALVTYRIAVAAVAATTVVTPWAAVGQFLFASLGGIAVGLAVAGVIALIRRATDDPVLENATSLLTPFLTYLPAEAIHASGVLAVVVTGLLLGYHAPRLMTSAARLSERGIWRVIEFLLHGVVFSLIGLQLPDIVNGLGQYSVSIVVTSSVVVVLVVIVARFLWVFPATYVPGFGRGVRTGEASPPWQVPAVIGWAGIRGVVSLAAAFAIPRTLADGSAFPERNLILFLTFVVIVTTLVVQGLSLPWLVRRIKLPMDSSYDETLAAASAQQAATRVALDRLDGLIAAEGEPPPGVADRLRRQAQRRSNAAWERLGGTGPTKKETPSAAASRLRQAMLQAERDEFVRQRDSGSISEETLRDALRRLDLEETMLDRDE
ncbi:MAG: putative Na+ or antiporter [Frankiales bacterium]|nr:putative Na+ or antiporter [Frankiales bacterium]